MGTGKRRSNRSTRQALRSPGRPPVARREHRLAFWTAIAAGRSSEDAARITELITRIKVALPSSYPYKQSFARFADRALARPP
jgi:hypothetical protein